MRILVIEDEQDLRAGLVLALREGGYAVDSSPSGDEGLFKAEGADYDAIILDVMLPGLNGWDVLARLRRAKRTPVLMLTARDGSGDRVRGLDGGADDYVVKPFDLPELLARLRALIRRTGQPITSVYEVGDVQMDTAQRIVRRGGRPVPLTAREYSLVEYLVLRRGEVVSRTALYEHLFDESDDSLSNLLDVHVSHLRRKLGRDFIQTRRGHGYVIP